MGSRGISKRAFLGVFDSLSPEMQERAIKRLKAKRDLRLARKLRKHPLWWAAHRRQNRPKSQREALFVASYYARCPPDRYAHRRRPNAKAIVALMDFLRKLPKHENLRFLHSSSYESVVSLVATIRAAELVGQIKINSRVRFGKKILFIDAIQGFRVGGDVSRDFKQEVGLPWANFLVQQAVEAARKAGFSKVMLIKPEENPYYEQHAGDSGGTVKARQERMNALYYSVGRKEGFSKGQKGRYMVLNLQ